ncbi:hypothetical protein COCC4DRAFT_32185, partial [Bipolaris maydis ATCC 48331]
MLMYPNLLSTYASNLQFHIRARARPAHNSGIQQPSLVSFGCEVAILMVNTPKKLK